jgi:hypothetical protein
MTTVARALAAALLLVTPASAGVTGARPSVALTASPAHVTLEGSGRTTVRVSNTGAERVVVDVTRAGFALDLRGRPRIVPLHKSRTPNIWLRVRPWRFVLPAGRSIPLSVAATVPRRAEPGDHGALVLLTTRNRAHGRIAVRMRLGVVVNVRIPGRIVHGLALRGVHVRSQARHRVIEVLVANRGNVTEELGADRISLTLSRRGHPLARLRPEARELLPRTRGYVLFRYRGLTRGVVSGIVRLWPEPGGPAIYRVFRLRL